MYCVACVEVVCVDVKVEVMVCWRYVIKLDLDMVYSDQAMD